VEQKKMELEEGTKEATRKTYIKKSNDEDLWRKREESRIRRM